MSPASSPPDLRESEVEESKSEKKQQTNCNQLWLQNLTLALFMQNHMNALALRRGATQGFERSWATEFVNSMVILPLLVDYWVSCNFMGSRRFLYSTPRMPPYQV